jgi:16S rRNA (cytosine1402-N4)-methyltransferase
MAKKNKKKSNKRESVYKKLDKSQQIEYDYHLPVLYNECIAYLFGEENLLKEQQKIYSERNKKNADDILDGGILPELFDLQYKGTYIDGTLGGGGHSAGILQKLGKGGKLFSFDKDPDAIDHCKHRFADKLQQGSDPYIVLVNDSFSEACSIEEINGKTNGLLLDLGVSSHQLDNSNRGISYRFDTPLDMRFGIDGESAKDFLHAATEEELEEVLSVFGEEPFSKVIARRIVERRRAGALNFTMDLRQVVESSVPPAMLYKSLSRVFQAIRIKVNKELDVLQETLTNIVPILAPKGRIVVISYHSLEDNIVKNVFKKFSAKNRPAETSQELMKSNFVAIDPILKLINSKPILPSKEEILRNVRARSAKLRVAEKI